MTGFVSFVGSGPGDPELLTLKAVARLKAADAVLFDDLSAGPILAHARAEADLVAVGKRAGRPSPKQDHVSRLLVDYARTGARVVRLKSGDPALFGRLEEEMDALRAAGIGYEVVPGVTSATAAAAAALKVSESEWRELQDEEKRYIDTLRQCVHDDYDATRDKSWRDVVSQFFDFEDRAPLYAQPCNVLCRDAPLIVYLDLFADVGSMTIPASSSAAAAAGAAAFLTWDRDIRSQLDPAWMTALSVDRRDRLLFSMQAALWRLQSYGALVTLHLHSGVTHVVVADGVYDYHRAHSQQQASQGDSHSHSHSSSQAATVARRAGSQAEKQLYATRWERLQERLRRLRLLDAPDDSHSGFINKEKRIVPTAWVDRTIARQQALQEAEGSQGTGVTTAATYASSSSSFV